MAYRGLNVFIADLRNVQHDKDKERRRIDKECANIRAKFTSGKNLDSYNRKKYVWKMIYMHMLGYEVDFGHMEMIKCLSASKYSEKHVGYVGISLLLKNTDDMMTLVINTIRQDLTSPKDSIQCLALAGTANIGGHQLTEAVAADVQRVLFAPATRAVVRKKAALTLLRLYRIDQSILDLDECGTELARLLTSTDVGVLTCCSSLLLNVASNDTRHLQDVVPNTIRCLVHLVINKSCTPDYLYYNTASPWLQVRLLRMLQYFPLPSDKTLLGRLNEVLERILSRTEVTKSVNKNNADHAILFEAINLIIHQEDRSDERLRSKSIQLLGKYISVREPNIRYLGLASMSKLAKFANDTDLDEHKSRILFSLKDGDISIRKRALELLFAMCNSNNAESVVAELLEHIVVAEFDIKEEMVLKIAILAERFASSFEWYVDTILQVVRIAGMHVSEEIWHRVVQIITNNESVQAYATQKIFEAVEPKGAHETLVCLASYVLGEFGYLLADRDDAPVTGSRQFDALHAHFRSGLSPMTQALMLSSYIKMVNLYDDVGPRIAPVFKEMATHIDMEVQQRAVEYLALPRLSRSTIEHVLEGMPPFAEGRGSALEALLNAKKNSQQDRDALKAGESNGDGATDKPRGGRGGGDSGSDSDSSSGSESADDDVANNVTDDLLGLGTSPPAPAAPQVASAADDLLGAFSSGTSSAPSGSPTGIPNDIMPQVMTWFRDGCVAPKSLLYEDSMIQIGMQQQYKGNIGRIMLFFNCKVACSNLNVAIDPVKYLSWGQQGAPPSIGGANVNAGGQQKLPMQFMCMRPFVNPPGIKVAFNSNGSAYEYPLKLPIVATRFFEPVSLQGDAFKQRWQQSPQSSHIVQVFPASGQIAMDNIRALLVGGCRMSLVQGIDNANTVSCVGVFRTGAKAANGSPLSVGCMMRLECNQQSLKYRITVNALHPDVGMALKNVVCQQLANRNMQNAPNHPKHYA
jgi:AP-2 complex subunit alpha